MAKRDIKQSNLSTVKFTGTTKINKYNHYKETEIPIFSGKVACI